MELKSIKLKGAYEIRYYAKSLEVYDEKGNLNYYEDSNGKWKYDEKGNVIYYESSYGYWEKSEYNEKGNVIYFENSNGFWAKWERDEKGNLIYFENSNGYWEESEYDERGNVIYYEDSDGEIIGERTKELTVEQIEKLLGYKIKIKKWLKTERSFSPRNESVFFCNESVYIFSSNEMKTLSSTIPKTSNILFFRELLMKAFPF